MTLLAPSNPDAATSLVLALVDSSRAPLLLLDGELHVVAASASFYAAFEANPLHTLGQLLSELGAGEWARPQLGSMLRAAVSGSTIFKATRWTLSVRTANLVRSC